ncbi:MAG: helix-turn-helix transcriptional regulator, partial [Clostridia bacterium]|nr:helix-turn-helix transcriptional regulator [Clostridia bacterium]
MGKDCTKTNENIYFKCRKEASLYDERLRSRESAADLLGVSPSSLADYELGNTKVVPVDKVHLMADLYNAPQLRTMYCKYDCPIGAFLTV